MTARRNACPPASRRWMPCCPMATTAVPRPCWPARRGSARRCSRSTSSSPAHGRGETGVIATFQENPTQLERILKGFSWSLDDPGIELMYRSPVDLYLDEWVYDLLDTVHRTGATRVAIDSLGDLRASSRR